MVVPQALYDHLRELARSGGRATYIALAPVAGINTRNRYFAALLGRILDEVDRAEHAGGRPSLSAVAINARLWRPGSGSFELARELDLWLGLDEEQFWRAEMERVYDYWSHH